ncbi:hypothetical protein DQ04_02771040 [Trypanosoma grayi]|uniref:hypothetical protein n=1 Tax=Trypanosoma grayi TaxID=71804 RepID=UPI0004F4964F|nr:hypothetical protein DQ04_02771040 [Trypanosoma grayi]KEG11290.1 hypothetical protein DQ04_02771040 [Trypanosoma grayi]
MTVAETLGPLFTLMIAINVISAALPLLRHRLVWYPLAFALFGIACLAVLLAAMVTFGDGTVSLYSLGARGKLRSSVTVPFDLPLFLQLNVTMTSLMAVSVLAMVCWMCHVCRRGWHIYIVPMLRDLNKLEETCWANALDLRNRTAPAAS